MLTCLTQSNVLISDDGLPMLTDFGNAVLQNSTFQITVTTAKVALSPRWAVSLLSKAITRDRH